MKISIVLCSFNKADFLIDSIQSILNQSFRDFELIIIDDCSSDFSINIINYYANLDNRIKVYINEKNLGFTKSLALGLSRASASYYCWIDADDIIHSDCLKDCINFLDSNPNYDMVYTNYGLIDFNNNYHGLGKRCQFSLNNLLQVFSVFHFRLFRSVCYNSCLIDVSFHFAQDYDFVLRFSEIFKIGKIEKILYFYRISSNQISSKSLSDQEFFARLAVSNAKSRRAYSNSDSSRQY